MFKEKLKMQMIFFTIFLFFVMYNNLSIAKDNDNHIDLKNNNLNKIKSISLNDSIQIALQNHPDIRIADEDLKKSMLDLEIAKSYNRVQVYGELKTVEILKSDTTSSSFYIPGKDTLIGLFAGVTASYNLIDPNKSRYEDAKKYEFNIQRMYYIKKINEVIKNVKIAYYDFLLAYYECDLKKKLLNKTSIILDKAKILYKSGQRPILDVSKAELDHANAQLDYQKSLNILAIKKEELISAMGLNIGEEIIPKEAKEDIKALEKLPRLKYNKELLLNIALQYSPDFKIINMQKQLAKIKIQVEKASRIPTVKIFASIGMENRNVQSDKSFAQSLRGENWNPTFHAGVQSFVPIYTGGRISAKIDSALSDYNKLTYNEISLKNNISTRIKIYYNMLQEILNQLEISKKSIELSEKHRLSAKISYESGVGTQIELQDAELSYLNSKLNYIKSIISYYKTLANLSALIGVGEGILIKK